MKEECKATCLQLPAVVKHECREKLLQFHRERGFLAAVRQPQSAMCR